MIRWKYLAPRLVLLGLVCLFYGFALDPLLRRAMVAAGQTAVGARVEIGDLDSSLLHADIHLDHVAIADPRHPMENLVEFDRATLDFDAKALLHRKFVIEEGSIDGLRIGSARETSGMLDPKDASESNWPGLELPEFPLPSIDDITASLQKKLEEELQSVKLAKQLGRQWSEQYEQFVQRVEALHQRIAGLRRLAENRQTTQVDPLRALQTVRQATDEVTQIQAEIGRLHHDIRQLAGRIEQDKQAVADAKQHDIERIRDSLQLKDVDAGTLSEYLLGEELNDRIAMLTEWVQWGRKHVPQKVEQPKPARGRGIVVRFDRPEQQPDFLIRSLRMSGEGRFRERPFQFLGTARDITSQPDLLGRPTLLAIKTTGAVEMAVHIYLDHTGEVARDRIAIECPRMEQPERRLGDANHMAVTVSPGKAGLWVLLDLHGDELSGQLVVQQRDVELVSTLNSRYGGERLGAGLQEVIGRIDYLEARVELSGTLKRPRIQLQCNLGEQLAAGLTAALHHEIESQREALAAQIEQRVAGELAPLEQWAAAKQQELTERLQLGSQEIRQLTQLLAGRSGLPQNVLGKSNLPSHILGRELPGGLFR